MDMGDPWQLHVLRCLAFSGGQSSKTWPWHMAPGRLEGPRPSRDHMVGLDYSYSIDSIAWFPAGTIDLTHTSRVSFRFDMRKSLHSYCKSWNHAKEKRRKEWHQRIHQRSELFFL